MDSDGGIVIGASSALVVSSDLYFPESLRWHEGELWFTDQFGGTVCRVVESANAESRTEVVARIPGRPSGLGWTPAGLMLVVSMLQRSVVSVDATGEVAPYADLSEFMRCLANDMFVDPVGRAYVGNYGFDYEVGEPQAPTRMVRVDPDRSVHVETPEMVFPNGTVLLDSQTLLVAESFADRLTTFHVAVDGHLESPRLFAQLPEGSGPDGIALDASGRVWVACWSASRVVALLPDGSVDAEIEFPGEGVYCAEVGGQDGKTLFLAIASLDEAQAARTRTGRVMALPI
jgi:sugar lactone lactonase YvrE